MVYFLKPGRHRYYGQVATFLAAPAADFFQPLAAGVFEKPHAMAGMLELVNVCPDFRFPALSVSGRFSAGSATGMKRNLDGFDSDRSSPRQFDEDASNFLHLFVFAEDMLVAQQISKTELLGFRFRLGASVKRAILRP